MLWTIMAAGAFARIGYAWLWRQRALTWDAAGYDEAARRLLAHGYFAYGSGTLALHPNAFTMPGYAFFLAFVYAIFGTGATGLLAARLLQACAGICVLVLVFLIARRVGGNAVALLATGIAAIYPALAITSGDIMTEGIYTLFLLIEVWVALECVERPRARSFLALGLAAGVAALLRPAGILWTAAPLIVLLASRRVPLARVGRWAAIAAAAAVLVLSPWWLRNWTLYHAFVPFNTSSANPVLVSTYWPDPPPAITSVWPTTVMAGDERTMNSRWQSLAIARLRSRLATDPIGLASVRTAMVVNSAVRPGDLLSVRWRPPTWTETAADLVSYVIQPLLVVLAAFGLWSRRRSPGVWLLASLPAYVTVMGAFTLGLPRYVLPTTPIGCALAALGAVWLVERYRVWRSRAGYVSA